jgi:hypothetical protein
MKGKNTQKLLNNFILFNLSKINSISLYFFLSGLIIYKKFRFFKREILQNKKFYLVKKKGKKNFRLQK